MAKPELVVCIGALLADLETLRAAWDGFRQIGLFQGDWIPAVGDTIDDVVPASFSGYGGLATLSGWDVVSSYDDRAVIQAGPYEWTHNGGPNSGWVSGWYTVNQSGDLVWAQLLPDGPAALYRAGDFVRVVPAMSLGSRFAVSEQ